MDRRPATALAVALAVALACALLAAGAPAARADTVLVPKLSAWRYHAAAAAPTGAWRAQGYDDGSWPEGPAVLGYGEPYIATTVPYGPNASQKWVTTYARRAFTVATPPASGTLRLQVNFDDGFALSLNGTEVARRSLPGGTLAHGTLASAHEGGTYETIDLTAFLGLLQPGVNVLAAEVHQTTLSSSDLVWDAELVALAETTVTRGPYLQRGTPDGLVVRWRTNLATASEVRLGPTPGNLTASFTDPALTTEHVVAVGGLEPGAYAYYSVGAPGQVFAGGDVAHAFRAAPVPGADVPVRLWVVGDGGRGSPTQFAVRDAFEAWSSGHPPDAWLLLGDNAYDTGTDAEFQAKFFDVYAERLRRSVLWPVRGNHDVVRAGPANDYYEFFTMPAAGEAGGVPSGSSAYYSFDWGNVHVVVLDSEGSDRTLGGPMLQWLRLDLAATTADWVIAAWHHPPYTKGSHDSDNEGDSGARMGEMRRRAVPILDSLGADLSLSGHSHSYERSYLLRGHTGVSGTLTSAMILDGGDGRADGDGPYLKPSPGRAPLEGMVHVVAGSAGLASGGPLNHPAMRASINRPGSFVIDVSGLRLDGRFVADDGAVLDSFTIVKGSPVGAPPPAGSTLRLALDGPHPSAGPHGIRFSVPRKGGVRLGIYDVAGRRVAMLADGVRESGEHRVAWTPEATAPGIYVAVLEYAGERRSVRLVHLH